VSLLEEKGYDPIVYRLFTLQSHYRKPLVFTYDALDQATKTYKKLNIKMPDVVEPATHCIPEFIHMIEVLLEKGYAYKAGENIYFDTSKLDTYYVFGNQNEEELIVGARDDVTEDENKRNKNDFVLWFTKSKFEDQALKWESPWGTGYPGWHIECSCISMKHLGEYMDIHCGGIDNMFPHHTNEIAQSEAYLGHKWCNYWFHVHHLNDRNGKMSKSKGGILTVDVLIDKGYDPLVYRLFCLQSHYRKPLEFSFEQLDNAATAYQKLKKRVLDSARKGTSETVDEQAFDEYRQKFIDALDNDVNTAMGLTVLYDVLKAPVNDATKAALAKSFDEVLGLDLTVEKAEPKEESAEAPALVAYVEGMIALRKAAKKEKNFAEADRIRNELLEKGIVLKDTREGTLWEKQS
ncbi:MAG: cysteine--tRNA ligase, partial [Lachnospiraceae bacterium]|nr:cysteine--tRNA ligase [Lachnospiraceae bacterium]